MKIVYQFGVKQIMVAIMATALLISAIQLSIAVIQKVCFYNNEPDRSILAKGDAVFVLGVDGEKVPLCDDSDNATMPRAGFIRSQSAMKFSDVRALPTGTKCLVVCDFVGDRDDCSDGHRRIIVEVSEGPYAGLVVPVMRWSLRPR